MHSSAGTSVQRQADNPPFDLTLVDGPIMATQEIVLGLIKTQDVKGATRVIVHTKRVKVIAEPLGELIANGVVMPSTYGELKPELGRVGICLPNHTVREIRIPTKSILGQVQAANEVPDLLAPEYTTVGQGSHLGPPGDEPSQPPLASCERRDHLKPMWGTSHAGHYRLVRKPLVDDRETGGSTPAPRRISRCLFPA